MGLGRINAKLETEEYILKKCKYFCCNFIAEEWRFIVLLEKDKTFSKNIIYVEREKLPILYVLS